MRDQEKEIFDKSNPSELSIEDKGFIIRYLGKFRYFSEELADYPEKVIEDLMNSGSTSGHVYFPCDVIDIRWILENDTLPVHQRRCYFSYDFARKYFSDYPVLLAVRNNFDTKSIGGMYIDTRDVPVIADRIDLIYLRDISFDRISPEVKGILSDLELDIPVNCIHYVPSLQEPKIAFAKDRKFVVNIDTIDIVNEVVRARTKKEALQRILDKRWNAISSKTGVKFRPEKYRVEFWINTPFWDTIVTEEKSINKNL